MQKEYEYNYIYDKFKEMSKARLHRNIWTCRESVINVNQNQCSFWGILGFASGFLLFTNLFFISGLSALERLGDRSFCAHSKKLAAALGENGHHYSKEIIHLLHKGPHLYWDAGIHIDGHGQRWRLKIGSKFIVDGADIDTHGDVTAALPDVAGTEAMFRRLTVNVAGNLGRRFSFRAEVDFSQVRDIMDDWIRIKEIPLLGQLTLGHQREPFSLESVTGIHSRTFVEQSLPGDAMSPGRNIGLLANRAVFDERMTWALGGYYSTGSFKNVGDAKNRISEHNGYNLTGRVTGLPWIENQGEKLLHLGLSFSHQTRNDSGDDNGSRFRARPETRLTDTRLVDTGEFFARHNELFDAELVVLLKSLSFQSEIFQTFLDASDIGDPRFWGFYVYGSYFITGEQRNYARSRGLFTQVTPDRPFSLKNRGWGAWELALRYSRVDLNDKSIKGGIESNWTLGLNWYLSPDIRFMFNAIHGRVRDRETTPAIDSGSIDFLQARFQIAL